MDDYIKGLRPARVVANLFRQVDMPTGTQVVVIPKLANLTSVGIQGADNAPITSTDWSDTAVTIPIKTLAGYSDVPVQVLDQSPYPVDNYILADLLADYDKQFDLQIIQGNGSVSNSVTPTPAGQVAGLYSSAGASNWTSYNAVTYTNATLTTDVAYNLFDVFGAMQSKVATNRFLFDGSFFIAVHPRRAWWLVAGRDANKRPLVESTSFGPFNVAAVEPTSVPAQGLVARLPWGTPVYASANIPTNDAGAGQDIAIGALGSDGLVLEGQMHTDVFPELLSGTLQVRFRVYAYLGFGLRYGQGLAIASGTGFGAPTGVTSSVTF
jgi:HK97 family phage major capsid protein